MTQAKMGSKAPKDGAQAVKMPSMAEKYRSLPKDQQEAIITFFNLHNASTFVFNQMSEEAKDYCRYCIDLSMAEEKEVQDHA